MNDLRSTNNSKNGLAGSTSLGDQAYQEIRGRIIKKVLRPGDALLEAQLAEQLGMSRTPIRDALKRLEREGLVVSVPNKGSFVESLGPEDVAEIYDLREVIEGLAARLLARRITAEQADLLLQLADKADAASATVGDAEAFHSAIVNMCGNRRVSDTARTFRLDVITYDERTQRLTYRGSTPIASDGRIAGVHRSLAESIISGDAKAAEETFRKHIRLARKNAARMILGVEDIL
ncbi:MAG: GntR family transcriptional regulator [Armatimonadetes bacterium]|nr:GntR family transcriptional regulator [Armatimonadota bacterium]